MPIYRRQDKLGPYYQFGNHGFKYRYIARNIKSRLEAYNKCRKQGQAIAINKYKKGN